jgi:hypothetical protein
MEVTVNNSLPQRLRKFFITLGVLMLFVYGFLPLLTNSFQVLSRMSQYLDENGIDPSRYYYTDVEQVREAELYLDSVLNDE